MRAATVPAPITVRVPMCASMVQPHIIQHPAAAASPPRVDRRFSDLLMHSYTCTSDPCAGCLDGIRSGLSLPASTKRRQKVSAREQVSQSKRPALHAAACRRADTPGLLPHMGERDFAALPEAQRILPPLRPVADGREARSASSRTPTLRIIRELLFLG